MKSTRKGFTLVELLVVIAILAILATVSVVGYTSFIDRANQSTALQEMTQIRDAVIAEDILNPNFSISGGTITVLASTDAGYDDKHPTFDAFVGGLVSELGEGKEAVLADNKSSLTLNNTGKKVHATWDFATNNITTGKNTVAGGNVGGGETGGDEGEQQECTTHSWIATDSSAFMECENCQIRGRVNGGYTLVTDASTLAAGDKIVVVGVKENGKYYALGTTQGDNNRTAVEVTVNGGIVSIGDAVQVITLEVKANGTFAFYVESDSATGYLYAAGGTSSNYLRTKSEHDTDCDWVITISDGSTTIKASNIAISRNTLMLNTQSALFACYASTQTAVSIYKYIEGDVTPVEEHTCNQNTVIEGSDPACGVVGYEAGAKCSTCGKVTKEREEIDALTHNWVDNDNDCTSPKVCEHCETESDEEPYSEHDFDATTKQCKHDNCNAVKTSGVWTLVTDVADLTEGAQIVIVAKNANYALSTTQNSNNRGQASVTKSGNTITFGDDVQIITLGGTSGAYTFNVGDAGYLYAASTGSNHLKTQETLSANNYGKWNITIASDGTATIKSVGNTSRGWLRYNATNNPPIFSCYGSGQTDVCIYVLE